MGWKSTGGRKLSLLSTFFCSYVDNFCLSLVLPIFAPFFLDPQNQLFSSAVAIGERMSLLGLCLMAFPFGQFFGAPILGNFADRFGKRKALLLTIPLVFLGLVISAISMDKNNLTFLFFGRLLTGFFTSNSPICFAAVSELSKTRKEKLLNFSSFIPFAGFSIISGAFWGGKLSDPELNSSFSLSFPLWIGAFLSSLNFVLIFFGFKESRKKGRKTFSFLSSLRNFGQALSLKKMHKMYFVYFLLIFAWTILFQFTPVWMIKKYQFTSSSIGDLAFFVGIFWAIGSGQSTWLCRVFSRKFALKLSFFVAVDLIAYMSFQTSLYTTLFMFGGAVIAGGVLWPLCTSTISSLAGQRMEGKMLTITQSIQSLAITFGSIFGGMSLQWSFHTPFFFAAIAIAIGGATLWTQDDSRIPSRKN